MNMGLMWKVVHSSRVHWNLGIAQWKSSGAPSKRREQDSGSSPEYDISLCLVERRCVEGEHREHSLQAVGLLID